MLTEDTKTLLKAIGGAIKNALPDLSGQVTFNLTPERPEPKVEIRACDVTKESKKQT